MFHHLAAMTRSRRGLNRIVGSCFDATPVFETLGQVRTLFSDRIPQHDRGFFTAIVSVPENAH